MHYGNWYYVILAGTKKEKAKDNTGPKIVQQLIIKTWRFGSFQEAWESGEDTSRRETMTNDDWISNIRLEVKNAVAETQGEFTRLYNIFLPSASEYIQRKWSGLNEPHIKKFISVDDPISLGKSASFILSFTDSIHSSFNVDSFRKKNPGIEFWVNDSDLRSMMKCCISDLLIKKFTDPSFLESADGRALGAS